MRWIGLFAVVTFTGIAFGGEAPTTRPNVLFIAVDDLRPTLGCYGDPVAKTPNIDAFARTGMVFDRAYCQQAVCNPSRQSLLSGRRPDSIHVYNLKEHFRKTAPDVVPLPEYFKNNGYFACSFGKIYHGEKPMADPQSWSVPERFEYSTPSDDYQLEKNRGVGKHEALEFVEKGDEAYSDAQIAQAAVEEMGKDHGGKPIFLAVGFRRPHLPFVAPKRYWDLYADAKIGLASNRVADESIPKIALHDSAELRGYTDIPDVGEISTDQEIALRRGYYACASFTDAQVGKVLDALARSPLASNTIVVFWADHGYHLGEKGLWCKTTNFELDTRVPLVIRGLPGTGENPGRTTAIVELLDLYPTLVDLAGLPTAPKTEGMSLKKVLEDPSTKGKDFALSQFQRPFKAGGGFTYMGHTVRTSEWRYVEWREETSGNVVARELYDEAADSAEMHNLAGQPGMKSKVEEMAGLLGK